MGYYRAGFDVVGVDSNPQPDYPFEFHRGDAIEFISEHGDEFDACAASPPCQTHSPLTKGNRARGLTDNHIDLIPETREAFSRLKVPTVIENVQAASLRPDIVLCGLMFGLPMFRHRTFELGDWELDFEPTHPSHSGHRTGGYRNGVRYDGDMYSIYGDPGGYKGTVADWQRALRINWTSSAYSLAQAIPPIYTEWIGRALIGIV